MAVNSLMAPMFSAMSRRRWAGFLEGINGIAQNAVAEERLNSPVVQDIAGAVEDLSFNHEFTRGVEDSELRVRSFRILRHAGSRAFGL